MTPSRSTAENHADNMRKSPGSKTSSGILNTSPPVYLHYKTGMRTSAPLFPAAIAVIRNQADVTDVQGSLIPHTLVVICKRLVLPMLGFRGANRFAVQKLRVGKEVEAIDAGEGHVSAILKWSTEHAPTVLKECCRGVGPCIDATPECGGCCNNPYKK